MSDLLWPGDHRADGVLDDAAVLVAMVRAEEAWLAALVVHDVAPADAALGTGRLAGLVGRADVAVLAREAEAGGNPVIGLVALLRRRLEEAGEPTAARWLHRGLTSQDVLDTALVLGLREGVDRVRRDLDAQVRTLTGLVGAHRSSLMAARTLTQHAVPTTFGLRAAGWLAAVLDADADLAALGFPVQVGGAGGTLAAVLELAGRGEIVRACVATAADHLRLTVPAMPWHTHRRPLTRIGDALVASTDVWGHLANDVLTLGRPEIAELADGSAGGSSTMPGKANPVLAVLLRRAALAAPGHLATLHLAAASQVDERADGGWHAEWDALRALARHTVAAAAQATALLDGLVVHADRMRARAEDVAATLTAEQRSMRALGGERDGAGADGSAGPAGPSDAAAYLGLAGVLVDDVLARAAARPLAPAGPASGPPPWPDD